VFLDQWEKFNVKSKLEMIPAENGKPDASKQHVETCCFVTHIKHNTSMQHHHGSP